LRETSPLYRPHNHVIQSLPAFPIPSYNSRARNTALLAIVACSGGYIPVASALRLRLDDFSIEELRFRRNEDECEALKIRWTVRGVNKILCVSLGNAFVDYVLRWLKWLRGNCLGRLFHISRQRAYQIFKQYDPKRILHFKVRQLDIVYGDDEFAGLEYDEK